MQNATLKYHAPTDQLTVDLPILEGFWHGDVMSNIVCHGAKLALFLNERFCCNVSEDTVIPMSSLCYKDLYPQLRAIVSRDPLRRPSQLELCATAEFWHRDSGACLCLSLQLDCGTFLVHKKRRDFMRAKIETWQSGFKRQCRVTSHSAS